MAFDGGQWPLFLFPLNRDIIQELDDLFLRCFRGIGLVWRNLKSILKKSCAEVYRFIDFLDLFVCGGVGQPGLLYQLTLRVFDIDDFSYRPDWSQKLIAIRSGVDLKCLAEKAFQEPFLSFGEEFTSSGSLERPKVVVRFEFYLASGDKLLWCFNVGYIFNNLLDFQTWLTVWRCHLHKEQLVKHYNGWSRI